MVNTNPILDTHIYDLWLPDGRVEEYYYNSILENLYEQVDENVWDTGVLK